MKKRLKRILGIFALSLLSACVSDTSDSLDGLHKFSLTIDGPLTYDEELLSIATIIPSFAGLHYDENGILVVSLKSEGDGGLEAIIDEVINVISTVFGRDFITLGQAALDIPEQELESRVIVQPADYTFEELFGWHERTTSLFETNQVTLTDIDELNNRITIGVPYIDDSAAIASLNDEIAELNIPREAVTVQEERPAKIGATLLNQLRPVRGGSQIRGQYTNNARYSICTLGINVKIGGVKGFLTNSHCSLEMWQKEATKFYQPFNANSQSYVGIETKDPPWFSGVQVDWCPMNYACRHSDSIFVAFPNAGNVPDGSMGTVWKTESINSGSIEIRTTPDPRDEYVQFFKMSGKSNQTPMGLALHKVGKRTGWTSGNVNMSCFKHTQTGLIDGRPKMMDCNTRVTANFIPGDSGSAVFSRVLANNRYNHVFRGLAWGYGDYASGQRYYILSNLSVLERDLGSISIR